MNKDRRTPLAIVMAMTIIIVALIYGFFIRPNYHLVNGGTIYLDAIYADKLDIRKGAKMTTMDDQLYVATRDGLTKMSVDGEHIWNKSYHFNELLFLEQTPFLSAVDITGKEAFIFDENGSIARIQTDYGIVSGSLNASGHLTLVTEDKDEHYIHLYNSKGVLIVKRRTIFKDDGYPVYVAMSEDAHKMMTSHLYVSQHMVESVVTFLDYSSVGEEFTDRIVGHERIKDTMVSKLHFIQNDYGVAIGDNLISFYKIETTPELLNSINVEARIEDYVVTDDSLVISYGEALTPEGEGVSGKVVNYSKTGEVLASLEFKTPITNLASDDATFYVIQSSHITKYKKDDVVWETELHKDVEKIYGLTGNRFLVVYAYDYEILKIDDI